MDAGTLPKNGPLDWQEKDKIDSNIPNYVQKIQKESGQKTQKELKSCLKNSK